MVTRESAFLSGPAMLIMMTIAPMKSGFSVPDTRSTYSASVFLKIIVLTPIWKQGMNNPVMNATVSVNQNCVDKPIARKLRPAYERKQKYRRELGHRDERNGYRIFIRESRMDLKGPDKRSTRCRASDTTSG
jgi:hypothetical protein